MCVQPCVSLRFHFTTIARRSLIYVSLYVLTFAIIHKIQKSFLLGLFWDLLFRCQFSGEIAVYAMRCDANNIIPERKNINVIFRISIPPANTILYPEDTRPRPSRSWRSLSAPATRASAPPSQRPTRTATVRDLPTTEFVRIVRILSKFCQILAKFP